MMRTARHRSRRSLRLRCSCRLRSLHGCLPLWGQTGMPFATFVWSRKVVPSLKRAAVTPPSKQSRPISTSCSYAGPGSRARSPLSMQTHPSLVHIPSPHSSQSLPPADRRTQIPSLSTINSSTVSISQPLRHLRNTGPAADNIEMGDLETSLGLCNNLQRFRLTSCFHISSKIVQSLADYAPHLSVLDLEGCPVGDGYLSDLVEGCPNLTSVNFNSTNVTFKSLDVILTGLQRLESLCLDGCQAADDGVDNVAAQIKVTPARARRASFIAAAANADVAAKRAASIRGATTIGLKRVSLAGSKPNIQDLRTLVYRAPNLEYIGLSGCETLTDAHTQTLLTGLCDPMQAKNSGPKLADLDLDGCELITDATLRALTAGGLAGQTRAHQHLTQPMGSMLDLLDGVGRIKFLSSSPLKVLGLCATGVTAGGVRALVRECGALEVVRLDYCEGMQGTFVESVAEECWAKVLEERAVRKAAKKGALLVKIGAAVPAVGVEMGRKGSVGSRLPIPVKRQSSSVSLTPPRTPVLHARAELPKDGWFRLIGHPAMDRLAAFEGVL